MHTVYAVNEATIQRKVINYNVTPETKYNQGVYDLKAKPQQRKRCTFKIFIYTRFHDFKLKNLSSLQPFRARLAVSNRKQWVDTMELRLSCAFCALNLPYPNYPMY